MNSDFNSFNSPANTNNGEPVPPSAEPEEKLDADETISEKVGATSDENGYGTDSMGYSRERNDLDAADYNKQVGQRVSEVYAAAEKDLEAEEKDAFPGWYDDATSTAQTETDPTPPEGNPAQSKNSPVLSENNSTSSETILRAEAVRVLEDAISAKKAADERFYNTLIDIAARPTETSVSTEQKPVEAAPEPQPTSSNPAAPASTPETPAATTEAAMPKSSSESTVNAAVSDMTSNKNTTTEAAATDMASDENTTVETGPKPLASTEANTPPETPISSTKVRTETPSSQTFLGKNGVVYSNREDAIDSFKD